MKKFLLVLMVMVNVLIAQSNHTITIDGTNDFSTDYERFTTTSGGSNYFYATWDANYLYFGFSGNTPAGFLTDNNRVIHIYFDTDPQTTPTNGTGTTSGESWKWTPSLPFTANYHYTFKTIDNTEYRKQFTSSWVGATFSTSNWKNTTSHYWEIRISRADLGSPSKIYVLAYIEEDWNGGNISVGAPSNLFVNTSTSGNITFNSHYIGFTLTSGVNPNDNSNFDPLLPVELSSFTAALQNKAVVLNWATATEINNYGFEVERSFDKTNWNKVAFKNGYGNSNSVKDYTFTDKDITKNGMYYYRLKQIDNNGDFEYSNIVEVNVNIPVKFEVAQNYPNPFNPVTNISFNLPEASNVTLYIFNAIGQQVKAINAGYKEAGKHTLEFDGSNLNSGVYFYKVEAGNNSMIRKMALIK